MHCRFNLVKLIENKTEKKKKYHQKRKEGPYPYFCSVKERTKNFEIYLGFVGVKDISQKAHF